jgi:hypothetical protein
MAGVDEGTLAVKGFLVESVLPVGGVVIAIAVLTLALFEVPDQAPAGVAGLRIPAMAVGPIAATPSARARVDDTLSRVMRTLDEGRRQAELPSQPVKPTAPQSTGTAVLAPTLGAPAGNAGPKPPGFAPAVPATTALSATGAKLLNATSALATAVRAIHEARTEEDIVHAEELVRAAREQMQANCATAPGPLCESAEQIRSLGY